MYLIKVFLTGFLVCLLLSCQAGSPGKENITFHKPTTSKINVTPGIYQIPKILEEVKGKRVGVVVNHTSVLGKEHLVDTLLSLGVDIKIIFSPEHGFKGTAYNGEEVKDGIYKGKYPIRSLYGKTKKPSGEDLSQVDLVLFDIQDVGVRFYTFISTLHLVMEAAAEHGKKVLVLDRPNPNGHYIDGPVREESLKSFVGMHPVPIVYGMTIGEYGLMINGEGWLEGNLKCNYDVIPVLNYSHNTPYELPVAPSPNLPNYRSVLLYPSLCLLEGTVISEGRGTNKQFQIYGHPSFPKSEYSFTPKSMSSSKYPKHEGQNCGGVDLSTLDVKEIRKWEGLNLEFIIDAYNKYNKNAESEDPFFLKNNWIDKLSGTTTFKKNILDKQSVSEIKSKWQEGIDKFRLVREKYLLYD